MVPALSLSKMDHIRMHQVTIKEAKLVFLDQEQLKNYLNLRIKRTTKLRVLHQQRECSAWSGTDKQGSNFQREKDLMNRWTKKLGR